jgi:hypothetical protein
MSRQFSSSADFLQLAAVPVSAVPLTLCAWFKQTSAPTVANLVGILTGGTLAGSWTLASAASQVARARCRDNASTNGEAISTVGAGLNAWHHAAAVFTDNTNRAALLDGANKGTQASVLTPTTMDQVRVSLDGTGASGIIGLIAHVAIWNVALSDGDIATLAGGANPRTIQPGNLINYWPLTGGQSPEQTAVGTGDLTVTGTTFSTDNPTVSDFAQPPMFYQRRSLYFT